MTLDEMREYLIDELKEEKAKAMAGKSNNYGYLFMVLNDLGLIKYLED